MTIAATPSTSGTTFAGTPGDVPIIDALAINTIRTLSMDAVQAANSGHPGTPMALAPVGYALWQNVLKFDPADPLWPNRDRFVLSNGHACMLIYSLLHLSRTQEVDKSGKLTGKPAVPIEAIKAFRQLDSLCPGHPEHGWTSGLETTTGPLGQGLANSVGMAMAEKWLAATFNRPGFEIFNFRTYAICGDGCMMEGISGEAGSIAGHLQLDNLVWIYDNNHITIEGKTDLAYSDDPSTRYLGYGWNVLRVGDANDLDAIVRTLGVAGETKGRPTLIVVDSHIGFGSERQDTSAAHGEPLGEDLIRKAKKLYGWPEDAKFLVPDGVLQRFSDGVGKHGKDANAAWKTMFANYTKQFPELAAQLQQMWKHELPVGWDSEIPVFPADAKGMASRISGGKVLNAIAKKVPWMIGGSADLTPSTKTGIDGNAGSFQPGSYGGRNLHFGIREHAMGGICNGLALSGLRPFGSGFMIFTDYMRGSMRLSAFMDMPVTYVFTHDSIGVGEDGPTHQPIEQLPGLRAVPGLLVFRPADANETAECWRTAMSHGHATSVLSLTRQDLPTLDRNVYGKASGCAKGAYVVSESKGGDAQAILIGTGSEVNLCIQVQDLLAKEGVRTRVVSMPCWQLFEKQDQAYRDSVLPPKMRVRIAVEMASPLGWERWVGLDGAVVGMNSFGASAPLKHLLKKFGFEPEPVAAVVRATIAKNAAGAGR